MNVGNGTEPSKYNPEKTSTIQQQSMLAEKDIEKIKNLGCYISGTNEIRCYRLYKRSR